MSAELVFDVAGLALHAGGKASRRLLFEGLSLRIRSHERWVVLGPNGAGKSSLLAALAGLMRPSGGQLSLQGRALHQWEQGALVAWRAWCPQFWSDPFPASVRETVTLARQRDAWGRTRDDAEDDAEQTRLMQRLDLGALAEDDVRFLSGGERQRVAVATAMCQGARLLLLDEPSSHLDLAHQGVLLALLREHAETGGAVVASLHDLNLAWQLATHVVLLDGRGGATAGPRDALMTVPQLASVFGVGFEQVGAGELSHFRAMGPEKP